MKHLETNITIHSPARIVWDILMDFDNYPNWNPFIKRLSGNAQLDGKLDAIIFNGKKDFNFKPKVVTYKEGTEFGWKGKLFIKGIFDGQHYFQLKEDQSADTPTTEFFHGEYFSGILAGMLLKSLGEATEQGFKNMNLAMKERAEAKYQEELKSSQS